MIQQDIDDFYSNLCRNCSGKCSHVCRQMNLLQKNLSMIVIKMHNGRNNVELQDAFLYSEIHFKTVRCISVRGDAIMYSEMHFYTVRCISKQ